MSGKTAKRIRDLLLTDLDKHEDKRIYRRIKKSYNKVPNPDKRAFLDHIEKARNLHFQRQVLEKGLTEAVGR